MCFSLVITLLVIHNVLKTTSSSKLETTTVDSSINSLPPTSTKQPSKLQQMSSTPGRSNTSAPSSILNVIFRTNYLTKLLDLKGNIGVDLLQNGTQNGQKYGSMKNLNDQSHDIVDNK